MPFSSAFTQKYLAYLVFTMHVTKQRLYFFRINFSRDVSDYQKFKCLHVLGYQYLISFSGNSSQIIQKDEIIPLLIWLYFIYIPLSFCGVETSLVTAYFGSFSFTLKLFFSQSYTHWGLTIITEPQVFAFSYFWPENNQHTMECNLAGL